MNFKKPLAFLIAALLLWAPSALAIEPDGSYTYKDFMTDDMAPSPADPTSPILNTTTNGYVKVSGQYRLAAGIDDDLILNDANADYQDRNFRYLFGEDLNNTFDQAVYSRYLLNVGFAPKENISFYTQWVADPWSWVGTTGEQVARSSVNGSIEMRYNLKYFGAFNSTLNENYRNNITDSYNFPIIKVHNGHITQQIVEGFDDYDGVPGNGHGIPFTIPEQDIDFEFRPVRKFWMDVKNEDKWSLRVFPLADQSMALTSDDPLELSNHKDYWQASPWLDQYEPVIFFTDHSIRRGRYNDYLPFVARDSDGNRLVLLRGVAFEALPSDDTYFGATVAAPYTPWDEDFYSANNIPAAVRLKHQVNDDWMLGSVYTFRAGLINSSVADKDQVLGVDTKYDINSNTSIEGEMAGSYREMELLTNELIAESKSGYAYKLAVESKFDHEHQGKTQWQLSFTQMDEEFDPQLSRYTSTRDDHYWGKHLAFRDYSDELEHFRLGDGVDINRYVFRFRWRESLYKDRFINLFDARNVHRQSNGAYKETVIHEEPTFRITDKWTAKGLFRWQGLPDTGTNQEPFLSNYYFYGNASLSANEELFNDDIDPGLDPSRFTYAGALQYKQDAKWTYEGFVEVSNDMTDFPRGLLNNAFRSPNDLIDGVLNDHLTNFLYKQGHLGALPPYEYHTTFRERIIWTPTNQWTLTFHAAQNGWKFATGIDDNINHQGLSVSYKLNKNTTFFGDYTHSKQIDIPKLIATNFIEHDFRSHHNFYAGVDHRINKATLLKAEYGAFGFGDNAPLVTPYAVTTFNLPTIDTEHIFRVSLTGDF